MAGHIDEIARVRTAMESEQAYDEGANESFIDLIPKMLQWTLLLLLSDRD